LEVGERVIRLAERRKMRISLVGVGAEENDDEE
jgi:hypothetical protein